MGGLAAVLSDPIDPYRGRCALAHPYANRTVVQGLGYDVIIHGARNTQTTTLGHAPKRAARLTAAP